MPGKMSVCWSLSMSIDSKCYTLGTSGSCRYHLFYEYWNSIHSRNKKWIEEWKRESSIVSVFLFKKKKILTNKADNSHAK